MYVKVTIHQDLLISLVFSQFQTQSQAIESIVIYTLDKIDNIMLKSDIFCQNEIKSMNRERDNTGINLKNLTFQMNHEISNGINHLANHGVFFNRSAFFENAICYFLYNKIKSTKSELIMSKAKHTESAKATSISIKSEIYSRAENLVNKWVFKSVSELIRFSALLYLIDMNDKTTIFKDLQQIIIEED